MSFEESDKSSEFPVTLDICTHTDRETGETFVSPFPVAVFGIHQEFFGVGRVIGEVDENPVIEVLDRDNGQPYRVMGCESWWRCPIPDEIVDKMATGELTIDSVAEYRQATDDYWKTMDLGDASFLDESGIDPES